MFKSTGQCFIWLPQVFYLYRFQDSIADNIQDLNKDLWVLTEKKNENHPKGQTHEQMETSIWLPERDLTAGCSETSLDHFILLDSSPVL